MKIFNKKAFTLVETLISTTLLAMLIGLVVCIVGITNYALLDTFDEFNDLNGYDLFLDTYTEYVKNATDIGVTAETLLYVETPTENHTFEFDHNRLYLDGDEILQVKNGSFFFDGDSVTATMTPYDYGEIVMRVYIDKELY